MPIIVLSPMFCSEIGSPVFQRDVLIMNFGKEVTVRAGDHDGHLHLRMDPQPSIRTQVRLVKIVLMSTPIISALGLLSTQEQQH